MHAARAATGRPNAQERLPLLKQSKQVCVCCSAILWPDTAWMAKKALMEPPLRQLPMQATQQPKVAAHVMSVLPLPSGR